MRTKPFICWLARALLLSLCAVVPFPIIAADLVTLRVKPSQTDPAIVAYDNDNLVLFAQDISTQPPLVVFLPGTSGKPSNAANLLGVVAHQGYRVVGLSYNDSPAIVQICPKNPWPGCSEEVRKNRTFGLESSAATENLNAESIVNRIVKLLIYLDKQYPNARWGSYVKGSEPDWRRIVVAGLSQGAGMAAYIAKHREVARVVLFSSPWDFYGRSKTLAPWLYGPSATRPDRWFAEYHRRENTAAQIAQAYKALKIPTSNILVFDRDLPTNLKTDRDNPYHVSTIRDIGYTPNWQILFGDPPKG